MENVNRELWQYLTERHDGRYQKPHEMKYILCLEENSRKPQKNLPQNLALYGSHHFFILYCHMIFNLYTRHQ